MEELSLETKDLADALVELLREHKGQDVSMLDLRGINNWTDFFLITTVSSNTHMKGLERHLKEFCCDKDIAIFGSPRIKGSSTAGSQQNSDEQWRLLDLGSIIIHLMTADAREFYDLERLWRPLRHGDSRVDE